MTLKVGSNDAAGDPVSDWQRLMNRFYPGYERELGVKLPIDGWFGSHDEVWQKEFERRTKQTVDGIVSDNDLAEFGLAQKAVRRRHIGFAFRGTGGIIGQDYVSRVFQGVSDLVEERNPDFPATMGGIPVGGATDINAPSAIKAAEVGFRNFVQECEEFLNNDPDTMFIIGGYSWGAYLGAKAREWLLRNHPDNYLCSFSIGDPTRPFGGSYYLGPVLGGCGISDWHFGDVADWRHCWLAHPGDMYTNVPLGNVHDIMKTVYKMVVNTELSDPIATAQAIIPLIPVVLDEAGIEIPEIFGALTTGLPGMVSWLLPMFISTLQGLIISGGNVNNLPEPAAAVQAAVIAMKFVAQQPPTRDHIMYHFDEVWPGQTYLGLAIQHVRDWASKVPLKG